ncbi:MAG TPA: cold shock domain-containing protein [Thermoplasmatales archaeon]|nr:MAG: cold-shock protein [Thermoplasmata archaeon]RLF46818.1 MAG: cold-shock protein [Thermoplasmata archaeon]HHH84119.1 cold shock domain-containing protein [Thermoplasmatales archaeon]
MEGTVKRWMTSYGFIGAEGMKEDIFVHQSDVKGEKPLMVGQKVKFDVKQESRGPKAVDVEVIE